MAALTAKLSKTIVKFGPHQASPAFGVVHVSKRCEHGQVYRNQTSNLAAYKQGRGGRSSFSGNVVTVFGGYGFMGPFVVNQLAKIGCQLVIPYRGDAHWLRELKLCGDLGQVVFVPFHLRDEDSVLRAMKHSDTVINLIGQDYETRNFSYTDVNVLGARRIARLARQAGVERLVHFSHLNASLDRKPLVTSEGSWFLKTKYQGEQAVREEFPDAIIVRPSDVYGVADRYLNYYAQSCRRNMFPMGTSLWKRGTKTVKSPVYAGDVSKGVVSAVFNPDMIGKVIEAVGANSYQLDEIVAFMFRCMRYDDFRIVPITPLFRLQVALFSKMWLLRPQMNGDMIEREAISDITQGHTRLEDLGVEHADLYTQFVHILNRYRTDIHYHEEPGEIADAYPPEIYQWPKEGY